MATQPFPKQLPQQPVPKLVWGSPPKTLLFHPKNANGSDRQIFGHALCSFQCSATMPPGCPKACLPWIPDQQLCLPPLPGMLSATAMQACKVVAVVDGNMVHVSVCPQASVVAAHHAESSTRPINTRLVLIMMSCVSLRGISLQQCQASQTTQAEQSTGYEQV